MSDNFSYPTFCLVSPTCSPRVGLGFHAGDLRGALVRQRFEIGNVHRWVRRDDLRVGLQVPRWQFAIAILRRHNDVRIFYPPTIQSRLVQRDDLCIGLQIV